MREEEEETEWGILEEEEEEEKEDDDLCGLCITFVSLITVINTLIW